MITRMITGSAVHTTSSSVLWVKRRGTGLALALKRTMMTSSSTITSTTMALTIHSRMPSWNASDQIHDRRDGVLQADLAGPRLTGVRQGQPRCQGCGGAQRDPERAEVLTGHL